MEPTKKLAIAKDGNNKIIENNQYKGTYIQHNFQKMLESIGVFMVNYGINVVELTPEFAKEAQKRMQFISKQHESENIQEENSQTSKTKAKTKKTK